MANTFHKHERLCSKKRIDILFKSGKSKLSYPIKVIVLKSENTSVLEVKVMFIVPKKKFKKAHDRNKIKRRMKEAYRLRKKLFYQTLANNKYEIAFLYVGNESAEYSTIDHNIEKLLTSINH